MRIALTGSSGLIGGALLAALAASGYEVVRLVRRPPRDRDEVRWDPDTGVADPASLEGVDAVVHLAGTSIAGRRWNEATKAAIRDSRLGPTARLAATLAGLRSKPRVLVSASAIGIYGNRPGETVTEDSPPGTGFLPDVVTAWEGATAAAAAAGIRVVHVRFGIVLSRFGGALRPMLLPFRLGLGGPIGPGTQIMSWVAIDDVTGAIRYVLANEAMAGPVNVTAPHPVTNREFARTLGRVLHRPAVLPLPAFALRLVLGEMADPLLLEGARVLPARLLSAGYPFAFPELEPALGAVLGR